MDASALKDTIPENARAALEPTARGAQLRRRAIAVGGFGLLVLGFLVAIGLGKLIALLLLLALGAGVALVVGRTLRRRGGTIRQAAGAIQSAAGTAARRPVASARTRTAERRERSPRRNHGKEAGRLNARGVELRREGDPAAAVEAAVAMSWHKLVGDTGEIVSIEHYGESADDKTLFREFGFTPEAVAAAAERSIDN